MSDIVEVNLGEDNKLKIHLHGATVISWISNNKEVLFVSKKSIFDNKKAIRGGIPICFPNFGPWDNNRPQHGFARIKRWTLKEPISKESDSIKVRLSLTDDEETRALWNFSFELIYEVTLKKGSLQTNLIINNTGNDDFDFTCLLHTYFHLDDISNAKVIGLKEVDYIDKVKSGSREKETHEFVRIEGETDRVYICTPQTQELKPLSSSILIRKENLPDTVVWNPWIEKAKAMADFDDNEYKNMICIEAGYVSQRFVLKAHQSTQMSQTIHITS